MKIVIPALAATLVVLPVESEAGGTLSEASELSALGVASIAAGSFKALEGSAEMVVESVEWAGDKCRVALRGSAEVGKVILVIPVAAVAGSAIAAGATVLVVAEGAGWILTKAGQVIAYVPRQARRELLFSEPHSH